MRGWRHQGLQHLAYLNLQWWHRPIFNLGVSHSDTGRSEIFPDSKNPVASWRGMAVPSNGDMLVLAVAQRWRQAEMTVPGDREHGSLRAKAAPDSGAAISSIPKSLCAFLELKSPGVKVRSPFLAGHRYVRLATGQIVAVKKNSVPLWIELHTTWVSVEGKPQKFAVMEGNDDTMILERITLGRVGICTNAELDWIARGKHGGSSDTYE